jgi:hypothetical protein
MSNTQATCDRTRFFFFEQLQCNTKQPKLIALIFSRSPSTLTPNAPITTPSINQYSLGSMATQNSPLHEANSVISSMGKSV